MSMLLYLRANGTKRRSGRKPGARVTNSARLFTPGTDKSQHSEVQSPSIIAGASLCFMGGPPTDLKNMADRQEWKGQSFLQKTCIIAFIIKKIISHNMMQSIFFNFFLRK